jgi:hypothetical protein
MDFHSLNPYDSIEAIYGDSPEELLQQLRAIKTPIRIVAIVPNGTRHVAYIMGDVRTTKKLRKAT